MTRSSCRRCAGSCSRTHVPTGETVAAPAYSGPLSELDLDDGFEGVADGAVFALTGGGRRVEVRFEAGYPCAQVFAPADKTWSASSR